MTNVRFLMVVALLVDGSAGPRPQSVARHKLEKRVRASRSMRATAPAFPVPSGLLNSTDPLFFFARLIARRNAFRTQLIGNSDGYRTSGAGVGMSVAGYVPASV